MLICIPHWLLLLPLLFLFNAFILYCPLSSPSSGEPLYLSSFSYLKGHLSFFSCDSTSALFFISGGFIQLLWICSSPLGTSRQQLAVKLLFLVPRNGFLSVSHESLSIDKSVSGFSIFYVMFDKDALAELLFYELVC